MDWYFAAWINDVQLKQFVYVLGQSIEVGKRGESAVGMAPVLIQLPYWGQGTGEMAREGWGCFGHRFWPWNGGGEESDPVRV